MSDYMRLQKTRRWSRQASNGGMPALAVPFEMLAPEAEWTNFGSSPLSRPYSRQAFLVEVTQPFNARMATPLVPTVRSIDADGDMVIILFDAAATARDGLPYRNTCRDCVA